MKNDKKKDRYYTLYLKDEFASAQVGSIFNDRSSIPPLETLYACSKFGYLKCDELPCYDTIKALYVYRDAQIGRVVTLETLMPENLYFDDKNPYSIYIEFITIFSDACRNASMKLLAGSMDDSALPFDFYGVARRSNGSGKWVYFYIFSEPDIACEEREMAMKAAIGGFSAEDEVKSSCVLQEPSSPWPFYKGDLGWFIAHRSQDTKELLDVRNNLTAKSIPFWVDELNMPYGAHWLFLVKLAIKCCRGMIILCTPRLLRDPGLVKNELYEARLEHGRRPCFGLIELYITKNEAVELSPEYESALPEGREGVVCYHHTHGIESAGMKNLLDYLTLPRESKTSGTRLAGQPSGQDFKRYLNMKGLNLGGYAWSDDGRGGCRSSLRTIPSIPEVFAHSDVAVMEDGAKDGKVIIQFSFIIRDRDGKILRVARLGENHNLTKGGSVLVSWSPFSSTYSRGTSYYPATEADIRRIYHREIQHGEGVIPPSVRFLGLISNNVNKSSDSRASGIDYWMYVFEVCYDMEAVELLGKLSLQKDRDFMDQFYDVSTLLHCKLSDVGILEKGSMDDDWLIPRKNKADMQALRCCVSDVAMPEMDWGRSYNLLFHGASECLPSDLKTHGCLYISYAGDKGKEHAEKLSHALQDASPGLCVYVPHNSDAERAEDDMHMRCSYAAAFICDEVSRNAAVTARDSEAVRNIISSIRRISSYQIFKIPTVAGTRNNAYYSPPGLEESRTCNTFLNGEGYDVTAREILKYLKR